MFQVPDRINKYKCLVKKGDVFVLGVITNNNIYAYNDYTKRLATLSQRTKYKYFTECMVLTSKVKLDIGSKIKYFVNEKWYYVIEEAGKATVNERGEETYSYIVGK